DTEVVDSAAAEADTEVVDSAAAEPDTAVVDSAAAEADTAAEESAGAEPDPEAESEPPAPIRDRPLASRRTPPPALFEPTYSFAEESYGEAGPEDDVLRDDASRSQSGTLVFGESEAESESAATTPDSDGGADIAGRILTPRQNIILAVLTGAALGAAAPGLWVAWAFALALLISAAHVGLHSVQFERFRRQHARRRSAGGGPRWILFLILKTGVTGAEIVLVAYLTGLVSTLF
ncbi:MAG: hypothetical protein WEA24_14480, partial [Gemmatimonadota bacterium]